MSNANEGLHGVVVPVITPVDNNENVDQVAFRAVIRRCVDAGVDGIFAGGSAGMGPLLSDDQWKIAMEIACDEVGGACALLGGAIATSTRRTVEKIRFLERVGFRHMAVTPTFYITMSDPAQFLHHFDACRQATDMDMVVYNIPSCTYSNIPLAVFEQMAEAGWYKTIKESSGDRAYFQEALRIAHRHDLCLLQGNEPDIEWGLLAGAAGIVPVCANYEPTTYVAAWEAINHKDLALLNSVQKRIDFIRDELLIKSENWIAGVMYGLSTLGIGQGKTVAPLGGLSERSQKRINLLETTDIRKQAVYEAK